MEEETHVEHDKQENIVEEQEMSQRKGEDSNSLSAENQEDKADINKPKSNKNKSKENQNTQENLKDIMDSYEVEIPQGFRDSEIIENIVSNITFANQIIDNYSDTKLGLIKEIIEKLKNLTKIEKSNRIKRNTNKSEKPISVMMVDYQFDPDKLNFLLLLNEDALKTLRR
jgi:hypothetical protein